MPPSTLACARRRGRAPVNAGALDLAVVIRSLQPDELAWFMRQALTFVGHPDPRGLAARLDRQLKDASLDADRCVVYAPRSGPPKAGVYVVTTGGGYGAREVQLRSVWHDDDPEALTQLVERLLERESAEAALVALHLLSDARARELTELFRPLGFRRDDRRNMRFELTDVPPLGLPLVLEAWEPASEAEFRELHADSEGRTVGDVGWSYLKRRGGAFQPDLWFAAREALDQPTVGYAFVSTNSRELDSTYALTGMGVRQRYRGDSEMLRRLVLTLLHELSGRSPAGVVDTVVGESDPKLITILGRLGFETTERTPALVKLPY